MLKSALLTMLCFINKHETVLCISSYLLDFFLNIKTWHRNTLESITFKYSLNERT